MLDIDFSNLCSKISLHSIDKCQSSSCRIHTNSLKYTSAWSQRTSHPSFNSLSFNSYIEVCLFSLTTAVLLTHIYLHILNIALSDILLSLCAEFSQACSSLPWYTLLLLQFYPLVSCFSTNIFYFLKFHSVMTRMSPFLSLETVFYRLDGSFWKWQGSYTITAVSGCRQLSTLYLIFPVLFTITVLCLFILLHRARPPSKHPLQDPLYLIGLSLTLAPYLNLN